MFTLDDARRPKRRRRRLSWFCLAGGFVMGSAFFILLNADQYAQDFLHLGGWQLTRGNQLNALWLTLGVGVALVLLGLTIAIAGFRRCH